MQNEQAIEDKTPPLPLSILDDNSLDLDSIQDSPREEVAVQEGDVC